MRTVIIIAELRSDSRRLYGVGNGIIGVFSNLKKAYKFIYDKFPESTRVSYSSIAGCIAKGIPYELDRKLGILKFRVE